MAKLHAVSSHGLNLDPSFVEHARILLRLSHILRRRCTVLRVGKPGILCRSLLRRLRDIPRHIAVHLHDLVRHLEIRAGTSRNQHRRDAKPLIDGSHPLNKRRNGLHIPVDHPLHQLIAHHEIRRACIFVDEKGACARLHRLHHICRLGCAAAGILRIECLCVLFIWQVIDEHGNIRMLNAPSVLRPDFHRRSVRHDILSPIPGNMRIHAHFQRFKKSRFPVVPSAHDQRNPLTDAHAGYLPFIGKVHGHPHGLRRGKGHRALHGPLRHAALSWQNGAVRHESYQLPLGKLLSYKLLIL